MNDSKQVGEEDRERLFEQLTHNPGVVFAVSIMSHEVIDEINILQATFKGMENAVTELMAKFPSMRAHVAVDGPLVPPGIKALYSSEGVVGGDARIYSIAAASLIAKVTRDRIMRQYSETYPAYGFAQHKGYGVAGASRR